MHYLSTNNFFLHLTINLRFKQTGIDFMTQKTQAILQLLQKCGDINP